MWIYYWEKYGYEKAQQIFIKDYLADKGHLKKRNANLGNVLDGKLEFLKMVKGEDDSTYKTLKNRYDKIIGAISPIKIVLDIWENEGIEKAMEVFTRIKNS
jgi:hypothetical protein